MGNLLIFPQTVVGAQVISYGKVQVMFQAISLIHSIRNIENRKCENLLIAC